jgi:hypothetical protein
VRIGRRPLFFLGIAITFLLMLIPTPAEFRWLNLVMAGLALFWFVLLAIEDLASHREPPSTRPGRTDAPSPSEGARG